MNNLIKEIVINGFRSIEQVTIICSEINIFSGTNDTGKSNILRALNLFFNNQTDFLKELKFSEDYNKVAYARAVMSAKMKQQIKIRIYFNVPKTYKSLIREKEVWLERAFDRYGARTEKYSNESKKSLITRLVNRIKYIYIPALKGENVLKYILSLIGEYELINEKDIELLNQKINEKTDDLTKILENSNIYIGTKFGLPTFLSDFWQRLSVDTTYDKFEYLKDNIKSKSNPDRIFNPNLFNISLLNRGEGIKSKYIPPLLQWLDNKNKHLNYIWGIDEPENSLEFGLAEELAELYYNNYALKSQIFLTSHSLAFINPPYNIKSNPQIYRCINDNNGATEIISFEGLFKEEEKEELLREIGILEIQKDVINNYRGVIKEKDYIESELKEITKPFLLTEGKTDANILRTAWKKLFPSATISFDIVASGIAINENEREGNADQVTKALSFSANIIKGQIVIGLLDNDKEGNAQYKGLKENIFEKYDVTKSVRKHKSKKVYALLLPVPEARKSFVTEIFTQRFLEIEHYFSDGILKKYNLKGHNILNTEIFEINKKHKTDFSNNTIQSLEQSEFENFRLIFDKINEIINTANS